MTTPDRSTSKQEEQVADRGNLPIGTGATGTRLVITLLKELRRRSLQRGLATLCVGGGQGAALLLESA